MICFSAILQNEFHSTEKKTKTISIRTMVFQKLTDTDKEQLAIFGQEHDKKQVSMMRALIMRGASPDEAKTMAVEGEKARNELMETLEKEIQETAQPKAKRAPRKAKTLAIEEGEVEEDIPPPPASPKQKRTRSKKVPTPAKEIADETENQITILA